MSPKLLPAVRDVPDAESPPGSALLRLLRHFLCLLLGLSSLVLFWGPLQHLLSLSVDDRRYSHIFLVPVISACVIFLERRKVFARVAFGARTGLPLLFCSLALYWHLCRQAMHLSDNYSLSMTVLIALLVWVSGFALCYGLDALAAAKCPLLLLLLMVPIPFDAMSIH